MHLKPEHLGELKLTILADQMNVIAKIVANNSMVREIVEHAREQLRDALGQKGFTLQGLDVTLNQNGAERRFSPFTTDQSKQQSNGQNITPSTIEAILPTSAPTRSAYLTIGRLDYHA